MLNKLKSLLLTFMVAVWLLPASTVQAYVGLCCTHCGGNMPMNIFGGGIPETHEFRVKLSQMFMEMGPLRSGTNDIVTESILGMPNGRTFGAAPREMRMYMTMLGGAYSFTDDFAIMAMTSYKRNDMDMVFNVPLRNNMLGNNPSRARGFTMHSEGLGDTKVLAKYRLYSDDNLVPTKQISIVGGLSFPTGDINKRFTRSPITGQNGQILPYKMQMGSGSFDPIMAVTLQGSSSPFWYGLNAMYIGRWHENDQGYEQGDEFKFDLYTMYQFHEKALVQLQFNGHLEDAYNGLPGATRFNGNGIFAPTGQFASPLFDPNNYGFTKLNITAGVQFQPFPLHIMELLASVPIHQDLSGPQLSEEWRMMFSYYIEIPTSKSRRYKGTKAPGELGF
ncbi:MAG: transporter [Candidatus Nitronauta litoralis]|uniref:Transporter n=1 Tax=Candidatus Nitronauta litoralis TaxID=2705533 RepID=A0A7T0BZ84_9BACT|nr:MAG: transporter [Candidatus Nitronauta litoralis]